MTTHGYRSYMDSPAWQTNRARAMLQSRGLCQRCQSRAARHIHHATYARLGHEDIGTDLVPLCYGCHQAVHLALSGQMALPL